MNKLYFGDNFEILCEMDAERVELICTDPPFNSGRNYNAFFKDSKAQNKAFTDIWTWDTEAERSRAYIENPEHENCDLDTYRALDKCLKGYDMVLQDAVSGNKGAMRAYLAFMGPRLAEMHRILKDTGSIYLHCDPTASHYLKGVMDAIWDQGNHSKNEFYRNEIVWSYRRWPAKQPNFQRMHDIILRYAKGARAAWNQLYEPLAESTLKSDGGKKIKNVFNEEGKRVRGQKTGEDSLGAPMRDVWNISVIAPTAKERLGYPTQKPRALYERMIKASSNAGDLVMDPFCGCGTTIDAAHTLKRSWIGIDITILALDPMRQRLGDRHGLKPSIHYEIDGYPTNMQEVHKLVNDENRRHDFSNWAVTRLGLTPTPDVGDGGKDGVKRVTLWNPQESKESQTRILAEVKSGNVTNTQVRAFCHTMTEVDAVAGIFTTIVPVSRGMRQTAADMGTFLHNNRTYPKLQFWQIDDTYFDNPDRVNSIIQLPAEWLRPIQKSERHFSDEQRELGIY